MGVLTSSNFGCRTFTLLVWTCGTRVKAGWCYHWEVNVTNLLHCCSTLDNISLSFGHLTGCHLWLRIASVDSNCSRSKICYRRFSVSKDLYWSRHRFLISKQQFVQVQRHYLAFCICVDLTLNLLNGSSLPALDQSGLICLLEVSFMLLM